MHTVFVGLSGGVDSATSAALLKEQGYNVVGVFIKIWQPEFIECTWTKDRLDAMRVAAFLNIPFKEIDLSDQYKKTVVQEMIESYQRGETPNPDVACNERIKFGVFAQWCLQNGADLIATGHYARVERLGDDVALLRGVDSEKDQSYFVYRIPKDILAKTLFPVGAMKKSEVREHAARFGLPVATKHDSQGLCFVGDVSMRDFLRRYIDIPEGAVLNQSGEVVGKHEGAALYTLGQRHGFTLTASSDQQKPHFVIDLDTTDNTITVSEDKADAARKFALLRDMHWLATPNQHTAYTVQARYREAPVPARIEAGEDKASVIFDTPHIAMRGQSVVVYDGDRCIGGGVIA